MVGVAGVVDTLTAVGAELSDRHPFPSVCLTVKDPVEETVMSCVVAPLDQRFPVGEEEVKTTDPPEQKLKGPDAEMEGTSAVFTLISILAFPVQLPATVPVTE